jgi:hypothetical protein
VTGRQAVLGCLIVSVFTRNPAGRPRRSYTAHPPDGRGYRPARNRPAGPGLAILDLYTRRRGDWYGSLDYG